MSNRVAVIGGGLESGHLSRELAAKGQSVQYYINIIIGSDEVTAFDEINAII